MAKEKKIFRCQACGSEQRQWFGRCPDCRTYDSLVEERVMDAPPMANRWAGRGTSAPMSTTPHTYQAIAFDRIDTQTQPRYPSGYGELDRVLGGGLVPGSLVLIGGDPGIGKSTLLLQVAQGLGDRFPRILYVAAEESMQQVKMRSQRLLAGQGTPGGLFVVAETNLDEILRELESLQPQVAVIDSIQTLYYPALSSAPGSVAQVRECTAALMQVAKKRHITLLIVGHVTKEGAIAGPKVLEHLVDTVLYFEGDRYASHRLLRSVKNRFGATHEIGIFEMGAGGLAEVANPSALFLGNREEAGSGTATVVACEGTRPLVVELQALVSPTCYPAPRRSATGVEYGRLQQILAVLEKRVGIPLSKLDAYVASVGGLGVEEPAADLGIALALVASFRDRIVDPLTVLIGEVGLGGQIRQVSHLELRLREAEKLGFRRAIVPKGHPPLGDLGLEIIPVGRLLDALVAVIA